MEEEDIWESIKMTGWAIVILVFVLFMTIKLSFAGFLISLCIIFALGYWDYRRTSGDDE